MTTLTASIIKMDHAKDLDLPFYATKGSAAMDIQAAIPQAINLKPGERTLLPTGLKIALPLGYELQIRSRSGLSNKHGIVVLNSPATIDSDYRGEIKIILANFGQEDFTIEPGMRVAQILIAKHEIVAWDEVETLEQSQRGTGGFGSTGT